jgi:protocatechuate 3,4-dioxygenase, beta subunit
MYKSNRCSTLQVSFLFVIAIWGSNCLAQDSEKSKSPQRIGGSFENSEYLYYGMPANLSSSDTSPGWSLNGQKLIVSGTMYRRDGKTPAPGVILYYYHTDLNGLYVDGLGLDRRALRHGYIRGWIKSDANGAYTIRTVRPAPYPKESIPAHIHLAVKEPDLNEYYIDDLVFDDDKLLTTDLRRKMENRGGSGVLRLLVSGDTQIAEHDLILGLNVPDYPLAASPNEQSGLQIGDEFPSFIPFHAWGPDRGSRACPVCKYGRYQGVVYVVGKSPNWSSIKDWLRFLEEESVVREKTLKVFFVYGNEEGYKANERRVELESIGRELGLFNIALTYVPSLGDSESEVHLLKINPAQESTFFIYRQRAIVDKLIDLTPTEENFSHIRGSLERTKGKYQELKSPHD